MIKNISEKILKQVRSGELELFSAQELLTWTIKNFHPRLVLSCSFGGVSGMVLIDMASKIEPSARVFAIDTGRLPQETYDLIDRVRERYDLVLEVFFPEAQGVQELIRKQGMNGFYESVEKRKRCCNVRKVEPLNRALAGVDAWISGLRWDQSVTREDVKKVEIDEVHGGIIKVNPLVDWTSEQVDAYVETHNLPVNRLLRQGYPSVGCAPCSRAIAPGDDPRAGRWWWENPETKECGLHVGEQFGGSGI